MEVKKWTWLMDDVEVKGEISPVPTDGELVKGESVGGIAFNIIPFQNYSHLVHHFNYHSSTRPDPGEPFPLPFQSIRQIHLETYPCATLDENANRTGSWYLPDKVDVTEPGKSYAGAPIWYQGGTDKTFVANWVFWPLEEGTLVLRPNDNTLDDNSRSWTVEVFVTPPGQTQPTGPTTVTVPGNQEVWCDGGSYGGVIAPIIGVKKGSVVRVTSTGKVDFGGAVLGIGAPILDADGDDWPTPRDTNPLYPARDLRKNSLICKVDEWAFLGMNESTGGWQPLKTGDHVRVKGRWLIENAHSDIQGFVFPELHSFYYNDIRIVDEKPSPSAVVEETISVAAPIYEQIDLSVGDAWGRYIRDGIPYYKVLVTGDGSNFHDAVEANAIIDAPPLPTGFTSDSSLLGVEESVIKIGTGASVDQIRSLTVRNTGIVVRATARGTDVNDPANNRSIFQAQYRVWWKSRLEVSPTGIYVGAQPGGATSFQINIVNQGPDNLILSELKVEPPDAQSVFQIAASTMTVSPRLSTILNGTFSPSTKGMFSATLTIISNDPSQRYPAVALKGLAPPVPLISSSDVGAYLEAPPGGVDEFTFFITNTGLGPLQIRSVTSPSPPFSIITNLPNTINPSERRPLTVRFTAPGQRGSYSSSITINSDADNQTSLALSLTGTVSTKSKENKEHKEEKDKDAAKEHSKESDVSSVILRTNEPASGDSPAGLDGIASEGATQRAFIRPEERPVVGEQAIVQSDEPQVD